MDAFLSIVNRPSDAEKDEILAVARALAEMQPIDRWFVYVYLLREGALTLDEYQSLVGAPVG